MKQPKKLTREQKECLSAHYLNCKDCIDNGVIKTFRRMQELPVCREV